MNIRSLTEKIILGIYFVIFLFYAVSLVFPFIWMILNSFKTNPEFFGNIWSLPQKWLFGNYIEVFSLEIKEFTILDLTLNSLFLVVTCTAVGMAFPAMASYVVAKYKFRLNSLIYAISVIIIVVPTIGGIAATFKLLNAFNIYNTYFSIILMGSGGFGVQFIMFYGYFQSLSWTYAEAAFVDGASNFKVFYAIMLPQAKPIIITIAILSVIGVWNDYFTPYMYTPAKPTLALGIKMYQDKLSYDANFPLLFALMIISIIPIIVLFSFAQKYIMESMVMGGIKG